MAMVGLSVAALAPRSASATLIESFENGADGWQVPAASNLDPAFGPTAASSTTGVTNGSSSLAITGTGGSGPNYGQLTISPSTMAMTSILANASAVSFDVFTPPGAFGFFLQFDVDIANNDTSFTSLDGFSYPATTIGAETTITVPITPALNAILAASTNPSALVLQVGGGFTAGNETMFIDNVRTTDLVAAPEPASLGLLAAGSMLLLRKRRK
jgi:hypothetical protein